MKSCWKLSEKVGLPLEYLSEKVQKIKQKQYIFYTELTTFPRIFYCSRKASYHTFTLWLDKNQSSHPHCFHTASSFLSGCTVRDELFKIIHCIGYWVVWFFFKRVTNMTIRAKVSTNFFISIIRTRTFLKTCTYAYVINRGRSGSPKLTRVQKTALAYTQGSWILILPFASMGLGTMTDCACILWS